MAPAAMPAMAATAASSVSGGNGYNGGNGGSAGWFGNGGNGGTGWMVLPAVRSAAIAGGTGGLFIGNGGNGGAAVLTGRRARQYRQCRWNTKRVRVRGSNWFRVARAARAVKAGLGGKGWPGAGLGISRRWLTRIVVPVVPVVRRWYRCGGEVVMATAAVIRSGGDGGRERTVPVWVSAPMAAFPVVMGSSTGIMSVWVLVVMAVLVVPGRRAGRHENSTMPVMTERNAAGGNNGASGDDGDSWILGSGGTGGAGGVGGTGGSGGDGVDGAERPRPGAPAKTVVTAAPAVRAGWWWCGWGFRPRPNSVLLRHRWLQRFGWDRR